MEQSPKYWKAMNKKNILTSTNAQKILWFFLTRPLDDFLENEIQLATKLSRSGVNYGLRDLSETDYISRNKRGKSYFYQLNRSNLVVKQLKIIETLIQIGAIVDKIKPLSTKIILFGSSSRGEDTSDSDVDLLIVSRSKSNLLEKIKQAKTLRKIETIIYTNIELLEKKKTDPIFYEQVNKGIVLWEGKTNDIQ